MADNNLYTVEEFSSLKQTLDSIGNYLPDDKIGYIWDNYKKISGSNENQPCTCSSASSLWKKAVDTIRNYIKDNQDNYNG
jgi:hypothetical protein